MSSKCYVLNLQGFECWQRKNTSNEIIYRKSKILKDIKLYFNRLKNSDGKECYMDYITGRMITIEEDANIITFKPIKTSICKRNIKKVMLSSVKDEILSIIDNDKLLKKYEKISEEFLYYNYFCETISKRKKITTIPEELLEEKITKSKLKNKTKSLHK